MLAEALAVDGHNLGSAELMREVATGTKWTLPDVTAIEIMDAVIMIASEIQRQSCVLSRRLVRPLH